jgi:hypothetical protein
MPAIDANRPLLGLTVGLSAAESEDASDPGFHHDELNRSVIRIAQRLLAAGARVVTGQDWRRSGIMEALLKSAAVEHAASIGRPGRCAIHSLVPDGHERPSGALEMDDYADAGILQVENAGMPVWWSEVAGQLTPEHRATARTVAGLLHLRERMESLCDARICIGGKIRDFSGLYPGIVEEGWRTVRNGKPLYVTALLGGASRLLAQASGWPGGPRIEDFSGRFLAAGKHDAFRGLLDVRLSAEQKKLLPDRDLLPGFSGSGLSARSGLTPEEWGLLIEAPTADAVGVMAIRGLIKTRHSPKRGI